LKKRNTRDVRNVSTAAKKTPSVTCICDPRKRTFYGGAGGGTFIRQDPCRCGAR